MAPALIDSSIGSGASLLTPEYCQSAAELAAAGLRDGCPLGCRKRMKAGILTLSMNSHRQREMIKLVTVWIEKNCCKSNLPAAWLKIGCIETPRSFPEIKSRSTRTHEIRAGKRLHRPRTAHEMIILDHMR